ncbi:MAG: class IV adenylate cyclase [Sedimentisphaerales bacterium]|nr:class IV adenylate cyclase [Sedimentisphaerales bacterium]
MYIEIEAKLKVDSLAEAARRLKAAGAEFKRKRLHTDTYFDDTKGTLRKADRALRIRKQLIGRKEQVVITYKGPRQKGRFKRRQEIQFKVGNAESAEMFLFALGYKKALVFQKKRRVWRLDRCEVALDELPLLGSFVEIEGPNEKTISRVQRKLGLSDLPHIKESYATLMQKRKRQLGISEKEVLF